MAKVEEVRQGKSPAEILAEDLIAGMEMVGNDFRNGMLFVTEVPLVPVSNRPAAASCDIIRASHQIKKLRPMLLFGDWNPWQEADQPGHSGSSKLGELQKNA